MTARGKIILTLIIISVVSFGGWKWWDKLAPGATTPPQPTVTSAAPAVPPATTPGAPPAVVAAPAPADLASTNLAETLTEAPKLAPPGIYTPKDNVVEIELSEYAGYAGLVAANAGLAPNENSLFFKKFGFKVKLTLSEEESWSSLNSGKIAASATTVDVLAVYGRQFQVVVPAQIGFSRGADGLVVRRDIKRINHLKGKILVTSQFTEADFFIRYLAQEAGLPIHLLADLQAAPDPEKLNLIYATDAFVAGDLFLKDVLSGQNRLAGCVTWAPKTTEVAQGSQGKAYILATSANLLVIADILVVNKGFAQQNPDKIAGLVEGLLTGNRWVRDTPNDYLEVIGKTFKWDREKTKAELAKVHLANLPESLAFFTGSIDSAGSFGGIYQSAILSYGNDLIKDPVDGERFIDIKQLKALDASGQFKEQKVAISPIRSGSSAPLEGNPLLSKNIRFLFQPNSTNLVAEHKDNQKNLEAIKELLQVSPGSRILLRGHVDNAKVTQFRQMGGDAYVRQMSLQAIQMSKDRASEVRRLLVEKFTIDASRLDTIGRGWEEPLSEDSEQNRRVEAQWFTLE